MRKAFYISALICASLLAGCRKENFGTAVEPGLPASLDVVVNLGSGSNVAMTRGIYDYESEISELMLIMFSAEGRKMVIDLTGNLKVGPAGGTYGAPRTYTLAAPVTADCYGKRILSGTYEVYAIANWSSPFCELTKDDLLELGKEGLAAAVASNKELATGVTGSQKFPMTGYAEGQIVYPDSETSANATKIEVSLKRLISHIEMNFVNGTGSENPNFIPHSYSIYNLPGSSWLMSRGDNEGDNLKSDCAYGNKENIEVTGSGVIEFFMLENVKEKAVGACATYNDRDKWSGGSSAAATAPGAKTWTYAPEGSTFIVVSGEYTGKSYIGNVSYTIHLGNFSGTNLTASKSGFDNFTVNRNEYQKYTITVKGVNNIVGEVSVGETTGVERQPGAEGVLTDMTKSSNFVLDGHYENVILKFALPASTSIPQIIVKTPYNQMKPYSLNGNLAGVDYKWVKFGKPAGTATLAAYPGADKVLDIKGLSEKLGAYQNGDTPEYFIVDNGTVYVQAYVDEYFYEKNPVTGGAASWPEFVNQDNRVLIFNPSSATSADGNTTLYPDYSFQISQRSIKTTYNTDKASVEAFGIETWNETGRTAFGTAKSTDGLDNSFGWKNNKILLSGSYGNANAGTWPAAAKTLGYTTSVTSNDKSAHVWFSTGNGVLDGYYACMSRNRDENNNGTIEDAELKWYLPAINQYLLLWCGENYLYGDTRLVDPAAIPSITNANDYGAGKYNLFTSSKVNEYWAVEGVSYGTGVNSNGLRCIRNLKTYNWETARLSESNTSTKTIRVVGARTLRQQVMTGEYRAHRDRDEENTLFGAFKVATSALGATYTAEQIRTGDLCSTYSEESDRSDAGAWRIPNQKELMLMGQNGYLDDIQNVADVAYASRTWFVNYDVVDVGASRGNPYYYWYYQGVPNISISTNHTSLKFRIRCVRDVVQ
ncbi:MAG: hypothetical protein SOX36_08225 [Candidatus Cryptobacteroides sp.]|nr:hypothetical protein [Candidatus Cryptobacteroides sp.]